MKKRSMHKLHIDEEIWKWYIKDPRKSIIVFAPTGKRYEIRMIDFIQQYTGHASNANGIYGMEAMVDDMAYTITPADVKKYIIKNLQKQNAAWELCRS